VNPARFRTLVSGVLIVGVIASAALITVGFVTSFVVGWSGSLRGLALSTAQASDFSDVASSLAELRPVAFAQAGLLVLVATPVARVLASVIGFALEGDRLYAAITFAVLAILLLSLVGLR
jgi:uncharacterized membrane protein